MLSHIILMRCIWLCMRRRSEGCIARCVCLHGCVASAWSESCSPRRFVRMNITLRELRSTRLIGAEAEWEEKHFSVQILKERRRRRAHVRIRAAIALLK